MFEKREIYRAIAEVAYAIARAGDGIQSEEREEFYKIVHEELGFDAWSAQSRFDLLEKMHPDPQNAFAYALSELKKYKDHMDDHLKQQAFNIAHKVADVYQGNNKDESKFLDQLENSL